MVVNVANQISKKRSTTKLFSSRRFFILGGALAAVVLTLQNLSYVVTYLTVEDWKESGPSQSSSIWEYLASPTTVKISSVDEPSKTVIAYAVSVTNCPDDNRVNIMDGAAVLHQSIRLASRSSKYDYHMLAFIHPGAQSCIPFMKRLGYEIQIRDTPFNDTDIKNPELALAQENSCCGTKEYLKLYSYLQTEFPVVVHLDLDCLVLKPLDDIFDLMLDPTFNRTRIPIMHLKPEEIPEQVDFVFTRDYGMVEPGVRKPHQIGVQGGFLIFRPNETDFHRNVEIIRSGGDFALKSGWGGKEKAYGGYYGAGTIQGLSSYYYGEISPNRAVEMNRCYFNNMVDDPYGDEGTETCRTLEDKCQDCRDINVNDIVTTHFTNCGKPFWCQGATGIERQYRLCLDLFREWHLVRLSLENEWINRYPTYRPRYAPTPDTKTIQGFYLNFSVSHCTKSGAYIKMTFPSVSEDELWISRGNNSELVLPNNEFEGGSRDLQRRNLSVQQTDTPPIQISSLTSAPGLIRPTAQISELIQVSASNANKTLVAYAVSVTSCDHSKSQILLDGAAVLHQSIRLTASQSKYAYRMVAFIHSDARECAPHFTKLGFDVQLRDTPFNETEIRNQALINVQGNSCCGSKEYIKLYSYLLKEYQIVVHMDLDTLVLKPMDDIFDLMLDPAFNRSRIDAMWLKPEEFPRQVDFLFTRDYNMVDPGRRQPHQIGVQGGFFVVRPNETDFNNYIDIILSGGNFKIGYGWGGKKLRYGGYYGAGTIQGLASYYYGHFARNRSIELNRCYFNAMVDSPMGIDDDSSRCRTLEEKCEDCRAVNITKIFSAHFTVCGKPYKCHALSEPLCRKLHHKWHLVRLSLEMEWVERFPGYIFSPMQNTTQKLSEGHCKRNGRKGTYIPLIYPLESNDTS